MPSTRHHLRATRRRLLLGVAAVSLAACGGGDSTGPTPVGVTPGGPPPGDTPPGGSLAVSAVSVTPDSLPLLVGANGTLTAVARAVNGTAVSATITWQADNAAVATVSSTGVVTAVGVGTTLVRARADTVVGTARITVAQSPAVAPNAPSGLTAAPLARGVVSLVWTDNSSNETGFELERRSVRDTAFALLASVSTDVTSYVDSAVTSSDTLLYRLRAVSADTSSAFASAEAIIPSAPIEVALQEVARIASLGLPDPRLPSDGRDLTAELELLIPKLYLHPDVDTVLLQRATSTAQVRFHDGTSVLIIHNKVPTAAEIAAGAAMRMANASVGAAGSASGQWFGSLPRAVSTTGGSGRASTVPSTKRAVVVSLGGGAEVLPDIRRVLGNGGYTVTALGGTVEDFRNYQNIGALYLDAHGGQFYANKPDGSVIFKYTIISETQVSTLLADRYRSEVATGDLTYSIIPVSKLILDKLPTVDIELLRSINFGITETFIQKHWQLNDAPVILHTCFGGSGPFVGIDPGLIRQAIKDVGATVVMSFDNYVWPTSSLNINAYFLDRLTGANQWGPEISPDRRPFPLDKVRASMAELGLLRHFRSAANSPNTTFDTDRPDAQIIGAPSIQQITVTDDAAQAEGDLQLLGTFSDAQGGVTIGGSNATVSSWTRNAIRVRSPFGANGLVVVEAPGGLKSNEVPLTEWRGGMTLRVNPGQGTLLAEAQVDVRFRADAHRVRKEVEKAPDTEELTAYISPLSFGRVVGTGSFTSTGGRTVTWNGTKEMRILDKATVDGGGAFSITESVFGGRATIDPDTKHMKLCFSLTGVIRIRSENEGMVSEQDVLIAFLFPEFTDSQEEAMGCLDLPMDDTWVTQGGQRSITDDNVVITFEWTPFRPTTPPGLGTKS